MLRPVFAVPVTALRLSENKIHTQVVLETQIQKKRLPVFVLDPVLKSNRRRRAMGTTGEKNTLSDIF